MTADSFLPWPRPSSATIFPLCRIATSGPCPRPAGDSSRGRSDCDTTKVDTCRWWDRADDLCCSRSGTCAAASHIHAQTHSFSLLGRFVFDLRHFSQAVYFRIASINIEEFDDHDGHYFYSMIFIWRSHFYF